MAKVSKEFTQLQRFLKEMFQFEEHDLDFGIYRITRLKRKFIENFIDGEDKDSLRATVSDVLENVQDQQGDTARTQLGTFAGQFGDKGNSKWKEILEHPDDSKKLDDFKTLLESDTRKEIDQR